MSALAVARSLLRDAARVDRSQIRYVIPLRNAAGVVLPFAVGAATGHLLSGLTACIGAINVAFSDAPGPYRLRIARMLLAAVGGAASVFVGSATGTVGWLAVLLVAVWGLAGGLLVALGAAAAQIGTTGIVLLLVFGGRPASPADALGLAVLVLTGGLVQSVLAVAAWPVRPFGPQQEALAGVFRELATFTRAPADPATAPAATGAITNARAVLAGTGGDHGAAGEALRALLDAAERIRLSLVALGETRYRLTGAPAESSPRHQLDAVLGAAGEVLAELAEQLVTGRPSTGVDAPLRRIEETVVALRQMPGSASTATSPSPVVMRTQMEALADQLRAAAEIAAQGSPAGAEAEEQAEAARPPVLRLREPLAILRANLTLRSASCRHALRLACALAIGGALAHGLGQSRSYWIPMTTAFVLKPDFGATLARGVARLLGTMLGLLLSTAIVYLVFGNVPARIALVGILMFIIRSLGPANYALLTCAITAQVVVLTSFMGAPAETTIIERGMYTLIGGALALLAYATWPTWERTRMPVILAGLLEAYRRYFSAVLAGYLDASRSDPAETTAARHAARLARSNAEASLDRLAAEPARVAGDLDRAASLLANSHRFVRSVMAMEAGAASAADSPAPAALTVFVDDVDRALQDLARALRDPGSGLVDLPDLRADQRALAPGGQRGLGGTASGALYRRALLASEAERIADSVEAMARVLRDVTIEGQLDPP